MTGSTRIDATHQDHRQVASLRRHHPDPQVEIAPETAARHGIADGDWVRLETPRGSFRQRARLVPGLALDAVNAERWWYPEREGAEPGLFGFWESNVSAYTEDDLDLFATRPTGTGRSAWPAAASPASERRPTPLAKSSARSVPPRLGPPLDFRSFTR